MDTHLAPDDFMDMGTEALLTWFVETLELLNIWKGTEATDLYQRELQRFRSIRIAMKARGIDEIQINGGKKWVMISFLWDFEYRIVNIPLKHIMDLDKRKMWLKIVFSRVLMEHHYELPDNFKRIIFGKIEEYVNKQAAKETGK